MKNYLYNNDFGFVSSGEKVGGSKSHPTYSFSSGKFNRKMKTAIRSAKYSMLDNYSGSNNT